MSSLIVEWYEFAGRRVVSSLVVEWCEFVGHRVV